MFDGLLIIGTPFAIIGLTAYLIAQAVITHRERMAKIEHGIDPDARDAQQK